MGIDGGRLPGRPRAGLRTRLIAGPLLAASALVVAAAPHPVLPALPEPSPGRPPPRAASAAPEPVPGPTRHASAPPAPGEGRLAGTSAGEGRLHPGREPGRTHRPTAPPAISGSLPSDESDEPSGSPSADPSEDTGTEAGEDTPGPAEDAPGEDAPDTAPPAAVDEAGGVPEQPQEPAGPVTPDPVSTRSPAARNTRTAAYGDRVLRVLPLGTGLALTGLGLGFFALRLRRAK
ncbi:hypothetical protein GO001_12880 [Streptomyces sp. NRRL B-1677]|uniref:hypothetical protein n=1 Tax=Streptomyces TaxID=1883 RepID=UPI00189297AD|nr:hypothetical protein [Streptomyces sp. NRRL B-1677]MBF6046112.1 hypothetical protein [Streptomyces sp. NRRL B-1677]